MRAAIAFCYRVRSRRTIRLPGDRTVDSQPFDVIQHLNR